MTKTKSSSVSITLPNPLPRKIADCHALIRRLHERMLILEKQSRRQKREKFGRSSAQTPADNIEGPGKEIYDETDAAVAAEEAKLGVSTAANPHGGGGRKAPQAATVEEVQKHAITNQPELLCPCCNIERTRIGFDVSFQLEYVPASYKRIRHVEYKYSCPECKGNVIKASKPLQPIDKGYAGPALIAHIVTSLYAHHLPFYRQEKIFANHGMPIKRSTMSRWKNQTADELSIIVNRMRQLVLQGRVIYSDSTSMPYILKGSGKAQTGYIWFVGGDVQHPYKLYFFSENERGEHPGKFLKGYDQFLLTDGTNKYTQVLKNEEKGRAGATSAKCWAHAYRMFEDAKHAEEKLADYAIGVIKSLFRIERFALTLPEDECVAIRRKYSRPILDNFKIWLEEQKTVAPTSLADAVNYTLNHWIALCEFVNHGFFEIHNNYSENALRAVVLGRGNWLFAGSVEGAENSAVLMSLVQTCLGLGINPEEYLTDVLTRLPGTPTSETQLDQFLPDRWKALREKAIATGESETPLMTA